MRSLRESVEGIPIVDVHEHHIPEILCAKDVNLLRLFEQSYAGWTRARPYPLPSEAREEDPMLAGGAETSWEALAPYLERSGSSFFVRNLVNGIAELYGEAPTRENWKRIDDAVRKRHSDDRWRQEALREAGIERVITDPYTDPLLDARAALGANYDSVMRINAFGCGWHPEARDHNGNNAHSLFRRAGLSVSSFDDYVNGLAFVKTRRCVALKNALAYDRDVSFDAPDEALARQAWGERLPGAAEKKAFGDFMIDRLCALAGEIDLPMQMHLGTAIIRGSHPLKAAGLIERHPKTRFLLMHLAYPWSSELLGMAFVYRNIWIDLTWSLLISPSHFKRALHEAIEVLPDESRMMIGGDNWHVEETFATMRLARRLIAEVLEEKVQAGYFGYEDAERLARRILRENAIEFFNLEV